MSVTAIKKEIKKDNIIVAIVPVILLDLIWDKCVPHLQAVVDKAPDEISLKTIKDSLIKGDSWLVTVSEGTEVIAVNTFEVDVFPTGFRVLTIPITGSVGPNRIDDWLERVLEIANAVALDYNCNQIRGFAVRKGWVKKLNQFALNEWSPVFTTIKCDVKPVKEK